MTPRQFEIRYAPLWSELQAGLDALDGGKARHPRKPRRGAFPTTQAAVGTGAAAPGRASTSTPAAVGAARVAQLHRQCCEHLALARERAYPMHLVDRLEELTARAHQRIYRRHDFGLAALRDLVLWDIPEAVRALRWHLLLAFVALMLPALGVGIATWRDPHFVLGTMSVQEARHFDSMYGPEAAEHLGRTSGDDWHMFGYYIAHNIGIAFQCYASGLALGLGSLAMLLFNGTQMGAVAGYLSARGDAERFYSFIVTHSAFELTAIVLSGAAGLRLGLALLAPGRLTRTLALQRAAQATAPVMYAAFAMLVTAAALEAFWSSAGWITPAVKYGVGAACWTLVLAYLGLQGRGAPMTAATAAAAKSQALAEPRRGAAR